MFCSQCLTVKTCLLRHEWDYGKTFIVIPTWLPFFWFRRSSIQIINHIGNTCFCRLPPSSAANSLLFFYGHFEWISNVPGSLFGAPRVAGVKNIAGAGHAYPKFWEIKYKLFLYMVEENNLSHDTISSITRVIKNQILEFMFATIVAIRSNRLVLVWYILYYNKSACIWNSELETGKISQHFVFFNKAKHTQESHIDSAPHRLRQSVFVKISRLFLHYKQ